ncbi:hypothetical protein NMG60_11017252 [Bertholletia excelsa]
MNSVLQCDCGLEHFTKKQSTLETEPMELLEFWPKFNLLLIFLQALLFPFSDSATVVVDGVAEWPNLSAHIGDSIVFKHKYHHNIYIFRNRGAFNLCNLTEATVLTKPNSTCFTWHPSKTGIFYFSFNNGSRKACQEGQKLAIKVYLSPAAAPAPGFGVVVSQPPASRRSTHPSQAPVALLPGSSPAFVPQNGNGLPFINSNPVVPLPSSEADSATILPVPTSGNGGLVVDLFGVQRGLCFLLFLVLFF